MPKLSKILIYCAGGLAFLFMDERVSVAQLDAMFLLILALGEV